MIQNLEGEISIPVLFLYLLMDYHELPIGERSVNAYFFFMVSDHHFFCLVKVHMVLNICLTMEKHSILF